MWAPLGEETGEVQYVHNIETNSRDKFRSIIHCLKCQRWNLNAKNGSYLYKDYFRRPFTQMIPASEKDIMLEYLKVIETPMDFTTLLVRLNEGNYDDSADLFFNDLSLLGRNTVLWELHQQNKRMWAANGSASSTSGELLDFLPVNAALAMRYWTSNIAAEYFNVDLYQKSSLPVFKCDDSI
jgi:hypothetical protein